MSMEKEKQNDIVKMYYPNRWRENIRKKSFCWFSCSFRVLDSKTGLYYISVSPYIQFYCESSGESLLARGLTKKGEKPKRAKLMIISDPHNKKILIEKYKIDERILEKIKVSPRRKYLRFLSNRLLFLGFDGIVSKCNCSDFDEDICICQEAIFVFRQGILEPIKDCFSERCGIIKYSKRNNSRIREIIEDFPTCREIDEMLIEMKCSRVSKNLYSYIKNYVLPTKMSN